LRKEGHLDNKKMLRDLSDNEISKFKNNLLNAEKIEVENLLVKR
jgi:hypothetical protein